MRQKRMKSSAERRTPVDRVKWSDVREEIADRYLHEPAYRTGYEGARRRHELASTVRALRKERGMSQQDLAKRVGTSQAAIARLELGGSEPRLQTLQRIADALDVDLLLGFGPRHTPATVESTGAGAHN
jgi:HTH-type transcriptional regulator / antitoxin HipB